MPPPDPNDADSLEGWLNLLHAWLLEPGAPLGLDLAAERAGMSSPHLHNLLTARRPLLARHVVPLGRALGLDVEQIEAVSRWVRQDGAAGPAVRRPGEVGDGELSAILENRRLLRDAVPGRWAVRAWVWTLGAADALAVFSAGEAAVSARTSVQSGARIRVLLRAFPVSVVEEEPSAEAEISSDAALTPDLGGDTVATFMNVAPAIACEPDILDFLEYRDFLSAWFAWKRVRRPRLSFQWLGRQLGVSGGHAANVLARRRNLDPGVARVIARTLGLDEDRARYLPLLVEYNDTRDASGAAYVWRELCLIRARYGRPIDQRARSPLLLRWYLPVILELSTQPGWREDPTWIASILRPAITPQQASDALHLLRAAGYLPGGPAPSPTVMQAPEWLDRETLLRFHDECLDVATHTSSLRLEPWRFAQIDVEAPVADASSLARIAQRWSDAIEVAAQSVSTTRAPAHLFLAHAFLVDTPPP